jgi:hypothetical protein
MEWINALREQIPLYLQPKTVRQSTPTPRGTNEVTEVHVAMAITKTPEQQEPIPAQLSVGFTEPETIPNQKSKVSFTERSSLVYNMRFTMAPSQESPNWITNVPQEDEVTQANPELV